MTTAKSAPTLTEVEQWPATVGIPAAAEALGISPSWGYQLVTQGEWPTRLLRIGNRTRVVTASLISLLTTGEA